MNHENETRHAAVFLGVQEAKATEESGLFHSLPNIRLELICPIINDHGTSNDDILARAMAVLRAAFPINYRHIYYDCTISGDELCSVSVCLPASVTNNSTILLVSILSLSKQRSTRDGHLFHVTVAEKLYQFECDAASLCNILINKEKTESPINLYSSRLEKKMTSTRNSNSVELLKFTWTGSTTSAQNVTRNQGTSVHLQCF